jgi:hypothetical protein
MRLDDASAEQFPFFNTAWLVLRRFNTTTWKNIFHTDVAPRVY